MDLLCDVIDVFLGDYPSCLQELRRTARTGEHANFQRIVHTIKGAAGNFFAKHVTNLAEKMEHLCRSGRTEEAILLAPSLEAEVEALANELRTFRKQREAA